MKAIQTLLCVLLCLMLGAACAETPAQSVDYAGQLRLNRTSETVKTEATVKTFVDGDTTHFLVPASVSPDGVLRARYLAVNTPEITGKVEEYGKRAAAFTKEKLSNAASILLESDNDRWNLDSTGDRHLVWVWYRPEGESDYRCLNLELLQNGLAIANSTANNRYGSTCMAALNQAKAEKLSVYSGEKDPDFYYGEAIELTLRELRTHVEAYGGKKVAFHGVVTMNCDQSVYVEPLDPETGLYFGMPVYYGYGLSGAGLEILSVGNEVRIVGTLQYYEAGGTWQVSGLTYRMMKPNDPGNIQKLSDGHQAAYLPVDASAFDGKQVTIETADGARSFDWAQTALGTSVTVSGLQVQSIYTSDTGAATLRCTSGETQLTVRAEMGADVKEGQTIRVRGVVDFYGDAYQIRVLTPDNVIIE